MLNFLVGAGGVVPVFGTPEVFLQDTDLKQLLQNREQQLQLVHERGGSVLVGTLGEEEAGVYFEVEPEVGIESSEEKGGGCFYDSAIPVSKTVRRFE